MKRTKILALIPMFVLASCSEIKPYGKYEFRLGKTDGNHLEISATLTNEDHENLAGYKKMYMSADLGEDMSIKSIISQYGDKYPIIEPFLDIIFSEIEEVDRISLYYKVLDTVNEKFGHHLEIGSDFLVDYVKLLAEKYPELKDIIDSYDFKEEDLYITPEATKSIFNAFVSNKTLTIQTPVSFDDLTMQMLWYGISPKIKGDFLDKLPGEKGDARYGTHPEKRKDPTGKIIYDDCDVINDMFKVEFSNTYLYQYSVKIGTFVREEIEGKDRLKLYLNEDYTGEKEHIEGTVILKNQFGEWEEESAIKLSVDNDNNINFTYNNLEGKEAGFSDENGTEFTFNYFYQNPFVFRDFHVVNVGLAKQ